MKHFYLLLLTSLFNCGFANATVFDPASPDLLPPTATISASATSVCQNSGFVTITFTGSGGTAPYTFVYTFEGGPNQTISTTGSNSTVTVPLATNVTGVFNYQMVSVASGGAPVPQNDSIAVTVNPPLVVNFTYNPVPVCSGTPMAFDSTVSGGSGNYSYSWDFDDGGNSTSADPTHVFNATGCGNAIFNVVLTVNSGGCVTTRSYNITVKRTPHVEIEDVNIFSPFSNCENNPSASNPNYSLTVNNISGSAGCITSYDINWGDGNITNGVTFPASHTYTQLGAFQLSVTAHGLNGCTNVRTYAVANQSNPAGGLGTLGATTGLCAPATVPFTISNWELNSPGTTYVINFGDGESVTLTHPLASSVINHTYITSSCPEPTFTATLDVVNLCDTTPYTAGNIQIRIRPQASFTGPLNSCVGQNVCFISDTLLGTSGPACTPLTIYTWDFGDPAGTSNIITGNGNSIPNGCHIFSSAGTYTVSLTVSNPCGPTTYTQQICVEAPLVPQFTLSQNNGCTPMSVTATSTTNYTNSCTPPNYLWAVTYAAGNCGVLPAPVTYSGGTSATSANPIFNFVTSGTYSITLSTTNSCGTVTSPSQTVVVKRPPTVSINAIANFCGSASITPTAIVSPCAPTGEALTYAWSFTGGSPSTSSAASPGTITYSAPGTYTVSLVVTNSCGPSTTATQTFTINESPTITNTSLSQTICSGQQTTAVPITATPAGTTFTWTATAPAGITGFVPSGNTSTIPAQTINNANAISGNVTYVIVPSFGGCIGTPVNYVITVHPAPQINVHPAPAAACQNAVMSPLTVSYVQGTGTPTYQWYSNTSPLNSGGTAIPGATAQTYTPPSLVVGTIYYYVIISLPAGGCSNLTSNVAAITINAPVSFTTQPIASQTVCLGGTIPAALTVVHTGGTGTPTYQWYSNTSAVNSGGTLIPGATLTSYLPPAYSTAGTYHYYVVVTMNGNGCGQTPSSVATVTVVADPTVVVSPATQTLCAGAAATSLTATASGGNGTYSYQWYSNSANNTTTGNPILGANSATYTPPTTVVGTMYYYVLVTQATAGCSVLSTTMSVTVIAAPTITSQPASSTVCVNGTPTQLSVVYTNGVGTPTYQWYSNTTNSNSGGTLIPGATSNTYQPTAATAGTVYYYVVIMLPSGGCSSLTSATATVTVVDPLSITTQPAASQTVCIGGAIPAALSVVHAGGTGTATYQWYSNTTAVNSGGTPISGATLVSYLPPAYSTAGTYYYYVVVTMNGNGCGQTPSDVATVTVVADPTVVVSPAAQTLCAGATPIALSATASSGNGTYSYQWYSNSTNNTTTGNPILGANSATYTPPTTVVGTMYYYVLVTQATAGCSVLSTTMSVTVIAAPTITSQPASSTVCVNGTPTQLSVVYTNGVGAPTYQWYSNSIDSNSGGTLISGATSNTYQPTAVTSGITYYYVVITLPSGGCSSMTSATATVTVLDPPSITTQPTATQSICVGGSIAAAFSVAYSGGTGTATYQWYSNTNPSPAGGTLIPGATLSTYNPPTFNIVGSYYYYAVVTLNGNGCGTATSAVAEVVVVADPLINTQPLASQTVCSSAAPAALVIDASGGAGTLLYQWYSNGSTNSNTGGIPIVGETSQTFTPPTNVVGTTFYYAIITTPASGCSVTSQTSGVTVTASPTFTVQPLPAVVCQGGTLSPLSITYINGTGTPAYQWYSNVDDNTTTGTAIVGATSPNYTPSATAIGIVYYYVIITLPPSAGCSSLISNTAQIEITPGTTISTQPLATQSLCVGGSIPNALTVTYSGGTGTASYQWYSNTTSVNSGGTVIPGATTSSYTPPAYASAGTYYYYAVVSLSGNGCGPAASEVAEVIVSPDPLVSVQPIASQTLCQSAVPEILSVVATGGVGSYSYQWFSNTTNSTTGGTLITGATSDSYVPDTSLVGTMFYFVQISQSGAGCFVTSEVAQVTINLAPSINQQPVSETVCLGASLSALTVNFINGTGTPTYQWYSNSTNDTSTGVAISGEIGPTFTPPATIVGTTFYYVIITLPSTGGCSAIVSDPAEIIINELPTISTQPQPSQSICEGGNIPTALSVAYQGGAGTATYQWYSNTTNANNGGTLISGATGSTYMPAVFTSAGTFYYYAIVTLSGNGCGSVASETATVIVVVDPVIDSQPIPSQEICQNAIPTDLTVAVSGGAGTTYFYQWYQNTVDSTVGGIAINGANSATYTPSTAIVGTSFYYVIISQATGAGCSVTSATSAVTVNPAAAIVNHPVSNIVCLGTPVQLSVSYNNGAGIPMYQWYSNTVNSTIGATPISGETSVQYTPSTSTAGTMYYYVVISFPSGGCGDLVSNIAELTVNANPVIASSSEVICSGNSFTVTPDESTGNVVPVGTTYTWGMPVINPPGSITGASAETVQQSQISQNLVNSTTSVSTVTYTVTPIWGTCIGADFTITVTVNPSISPNVTVSNSTCYNASNGSITTNITGGIPFPTVPYQITWTGPGTFTSSAPSIFNLAPGIYTLTINDAGGCPFTSTYTITEPNEIIITTDSENDITCFGDSDGAISITLAGGTLPYQYTWTKNTVFYSNAEDISNLGPGTYNISVTDANACGPATATFTITEPPLLTLNLASQTNVLCYGYATGAISVNVAGGTQVEVTPGVFSYIFAWTGPGSFSSSAQNLTDLIAGTYNLVVTDQHGCTQSLSVTVTQTPEIIITAVTTPITCYGADNASIALTVTGGVGPYQAAWSNLATGLFQDNLSAGTYVITITDALGCPKPITVVIPQAPVFMVDPIVQQISCSGANDGSINLNLTGGISPITMTWTDGSTAGLIRNNLGPGIYTATISDGTPCHITRTFIIVEPQPLIVTATTVNAFECENANSGSINLTVAGGTGPYSFAWTNGATTEDLANITSGTYAVTVTDARGCTKNAQFTITRPAPIVIAMDTETVANCADGFVEQIFTAQVSGGLAPFTYTWSSGTISGPNDETMTSTQNTTVVFEATDSLGCSASYTFDVVIPIIDDADFSTTSIGYETYGIYSIVDPIQFTNGAQGDYTMISWNFGDGAFSTEENPVHSYVAEGDYVVTQTVTYPHGCVYTHVITLTIKKGYFLVVPDAFTPNDDTLNDTFRPLAKGLENVRLSVYDTWGSLIYSEQGTVLVGWDGKIKGVPAENGNYYCKVTAQTFYNTTVEVSHPFVLIN